MVLWGATQILLQDWKMYFPSCWKCFWQRALSYQTSSKLPELKRVAWAKESCLAEGHSTLHSMNIWYRGINPNLSQNSGPLWKVISELFMWLIEAFIETASEPTLSLQILLSLSKWLSRCILRTAGVPGILLGGLWGPPLPNHVSAWGWIFFKYNQNNTLRQPECRSRYESPAVFGGVRFQRDLQK